MNSRDGASPELDPIEVTPVGIVRGGRSGRLDDDWGSVDSVIELDGRRFGPESVMGLEDFSHLDVVFVFNQLDATSEASGARTPRGRSDMPLVGIFAQRASGRPNRLGVSTCQILGVEGPSVKVRGLDALDGTPVLDMKPHVREMGPQGDFHQPDWIGTLMKDYWTSGA